MVSSVAFKSRERPDSRSNEDAHIMGQPWTSARVLKHESVEENAYLETLYNCVIHRVKGSFGPNLTFSSTTEYHFDSELSLIHREQRKLFLHEVQLLVRILSLIVKMTSNHQRGLAVICSGNKACSSLEMPRHSMQTVSPMPRMMWRWHLCGGIRSRNPPIPVTVASGTLLILPDTSLCRAQERDQPGEVFLMSNLRAEIRTERVVSGEEMEMGLGDTIGQDRCWPTHI